MKQFDLSEHLNNKQRSVLQLFETLVQKWNKKNNLVSAADINHLFDRHIKDSLQALVFLDKKEGTALDMGSGTGFPVIPLAIALPGWNFIAVERRARRCSILRSFCRELSLNNIEVMESDIDLIRARCVDLVTCRALSSLDEDWKRASRLLLKGGQFITFKTLSQELHRLPKGVRIHKYERDFGQKDYQLISIPFPH